LLTVPEIAENGAVVPVTVTSSLRNTEQIHILVEKNPNILAASFVIPFGTEGFVTTRVKMRETSKVIALVKSNGKFYRFSKEVKVTAGGCGG
jgi:sulfur-oxidizing protein SoxY